jgi:DNA modification methylase
MIPGLTLLPGDWITRLRELPAESFHCVVSSPPYWALRDYSLPKTKWPAISYTPMPGSMRIHVPKWEGCLGLEPTPEMFTAHIVYGFREVWRVLRNDGTLWINFGDTYTSTGGHTDTACNERRGQYNLGNRPEHNKRDLRVRGTKEKDLVGIPWRVAFALQAEGWYLRRDQIWHKPNCMPESAHDRPTTSHEYIFILSKAPRYFYDAEAIKEPSSPNSHPRGAGVNPKAKPHGRNSRMNVARDVGHADRSVKQNASFSAAVKDLVPNRNSRSVWRITTKPFKGAHFATFPPEIPRRAIMAGTSERGACGKCGAPWERIVGKSTSFESGSGKAGNLPVGKNGYAVQGGNISIRSGPVCSTTTTGWQPTCICHGKFVKRQVIIPARITPEQAARWGADKNGEYNGQSTKDHTAAGVQDASAIKQRIIENATKSRTKTVRVYEPAIPLDQHPIVPCQVLDPFGGSGTTGEVALTLGRLCTLIELSEEYLELIKSRCSQALEKKVQAARRPVSAARSRAQHSRPDARQISGLSPDVHAEAPGRTARPGHQPISPQTTFLEILETPKQNAA